MFVPKKFELNDTAVIADLLNSYDFALLVTTPGGEPRASHLPMIFDPDLGDHGTLLAHMARANPQWQDFTDAPESDVLVVFQGPHGYVSPNWYAKTRATVPTWNYLAVHIYGRPRIIESPAEVRLLLDRLVARHEGQRSKPWDLDSQPPDYVARMIEAIVAFEIPVNRIEAKAKVSQNKGHDDQVGVVTALEADGGSENLDLARAMRRVLGSEPG